MIWRLARLSLLFLPLLAACGRPAASAPADFALGYSWQEGSLPPPYHYEYTITLRADGSASFSLTPDYPGEGVPTWEQTFALDPAQRDALYSDLVAAGLLRLRWSADPAPPVGGRSAWLRASAAGREISIPAFVRGPQRAAAEAIFAQVEAVVPPDLRAELIARREAYVADYK